MEAPPNFANQPEDAKDDGDKPRYEAAAQYGAFERASEQLENRRVVRPPLGEVVDMWTRLEMAKEKDDEADDEDESSVATTGARHTVLSTEIKKPDIDSTEFDDTLTQMETGFDDATATAAPTDDSPQFTDTSVQDGQLAISPNDVSADLTATAVKGYLMYRRSEQPTPQAAVSPAAQNLSPTADTPTRLTTPQADEPGAPTAMPAFMHQNTPMASPPFSPQAAHMQNDNLLASGQVPVSHVLQAGQPTHRDPQHLLAKPKNQLLSNIMTPWFWLMLAAIVIAFFAAALI